MRDTKTFLVTLDNSATVEGNTTASINGEILVECQNPMQAVCALLIERGASPDDWARFSRDNGRNCGAVKLISPSRWPTLRVLQPKPQPASKPRVESDSPRVFKITPRKMAA
jgi:hypothetical protein